MFPEHAGRTLQLNEVSLKGVRESDRSIVLRGGKADHMGKETTELCSSKDSKRGKRLSEKSATELKCTSNQK